MSRTCPLPPPSVRVRRLPAHVQLPPGRLVLDRATVALEAGRALLAGPPLPAGRGEARDGGPGPCGGGLAGWEVRWAANGESCARRAQSICRSLALTPRPSIHRRKHLLRMNCVVWIASSIAVCWARERRSLYSYRSILPLLSRTTDLAQTS